MEFIFSKPRVLDQEWAGHAFRINPDQFNQEQLMRRKYYTTSSRKFTDTSWGGHFAVNPFPQFTRNCDVAHKSIYSGSSGCGRWWSENLDDPQQLLHIRAGIPKYNSMTTFFANFFSVQSSVLSRSGRADSIWYKLGYAAGFVGTLVLQPFILGGSAIKFFMSTPRTKFYYLNPTMHMYWRAVASMMNTYMVNVGLTSYFTPEKNKEFFDPVVSNSVAQEDWRAQQSIYGKDFVMHNGGIDVFAVSTRAQRLGQIYRKEVEAALDETVGKLTFSPTASNADKEAQRTAAMNAFVKKMDTTIAALPVKQNIDQPIRSASNTAGVESPLPQSLLEVYEDYQFSSAMDPSTAAPEGDKVENSSFIDSIGKGWAEVSGYFSKFGQAFKGNMEMGAEFVTFRVNNTGTQSESFSNSFTESGLMSTINSNSSTVRSAKHNMAGGNLGGGVGAILSAGAEGLAGALDSVGLGGAMALAGNAFVDIQKVYQNSSVDMMTTSITIPLRAWSADPWTIAKDIAYPLYCIMALGMPKSTGTQSYDEPFLLELFLKGRSQLREGRVRSISITRGSGDNGWTKDGHALAIDVTVEFEDMSGVIGVPIAPVTSRLLSGISATVETGVKIGANAVGLDGAAAADTVQNLTAALSQSSYSEDSKFGDYQNVLAAVDLHSQINTFSGKYKLNLAKTRVEMQQWRSPHLIMSGMFDTLPGSIIQAMGQPTSRN